MAKIQSIATPGRLEMVEACKMLFGAQPVDVIEPIKTSSETLGWVEAICACIRQEAEGKGNLTRIRALAEAAEYLSLEFSNWSGCQHEEMRGRLHDAGVTGSAPEPVGEAF